MLAIWSIHDCKKIREMSTAGETCSETKGSNVIECEGKGKDRAERRGEGYACTRGLPCEERESAYLAAGWALSRRLR